MTCMGIAWSCIVEYLQLSDLDALALLLMIYCIRRSYFVSTYRRGKLWMKRVQGCRCINRNK